ncbi:MAG: MAPEG family protein [Methylobacteriaceae bacterium]|nr:MAPEG family protein [Methylobacteriaceae bacterium]
MTMPSILLPVFVQVLLSFGLLFLTGQRRFAAIRAGEVRPREVSAGERGWPAPAQWAANAFTNQFEVPVLFHALVAFAILTRKADLLFVALSWVFVATRILHAAIYVTTNHVPNRFRAYLAGVVVLLAMWLIFMGRILLAPALP